MRKTFVLAICLCVAASAAAAKRRAVRSVETPSGPCHVRGLANFHYSTDGGNTWSVSDEIPTGAGAWDITAFADEPMSLLAVVGREVFASADGGCNWVRQHTIVEDIHHKIQIARGTAGRAFIWTEEFALRYDGGAVVALTLPERIGAVGVDPGNRDHVRILGVTDGKSWESFDGGASWHDAGGSAGGFIQAAAFDPTDFTHIVAGVQLKGIRITRDGGRTWTNGAATSRAVCFLSVATAQPNVIWATLAAQGSQPNVYRSTNGGTQLTAVGRVENVPDSVCLPVLANPHDASRAVVPFMQFHELDATTSGVRSWSCCGTRMNRLAWSPDDPARVYVQASTP
jgi:hypothetical protein